MAFRSQEYAWRDLKVVMAGRPVAGVVALDFETTRTKTDIYASGDDPHARTYGNKERKGSITFLMSELIALNQSAQAKMGVDADCLDIRFDIAAAFGDPPGRIIQYNLLDCDITGWKIDLKQNDPNAQIQLPLMIRKINQIGV